MEKPKKRGGCLKSLTVMLLLLVLVSVGGFFYAQKWYADTISKPNSDDKSLVNVEVVTGSSAVDIGKLLKKNDLINNEIVWQIYIKLNKPNFLADKYEFPKNLSIEQIATILKEGQKDKVVWVTIPEGLRMDEIEAILSAKLSDVPEGNYDKDTFNSLINSPDNFLANIGSETGTYILNEKPSESSLEGFLFPDTYAFRTDVNAEEVLKTLLDNFMSKTKDINPTNGLTFYENLVVASIVEREANPADHEGVAEVFLSRVEEKDKLGSDITVLYILKRWNPEPTAKELLIESPYNTRKNYGLPPTPISNPGTSAISKTSTAEPGIYHFFLADENGKIHYGKNLTEHNKNICKYITKTC